MKKEIIDAAMQKIGRFSKKVIISGGEPTLFPEIVQYIAKKCILSKNKYNYPDEISIQTNGSWATNIEEAKSKLTEFKEWGITDIELSGFDKFHGEFHKGLIMPELVTLADDTNLFKSISIFRSSEVDLKFLGRAKELKENIVFKNDCILAEDNISINEYGDISICEWGNTCYLGSVIDTEIDDIEKIEFINVLKKKGVLELLNQYNNKFKKNIYFDGTCDICELCHKVTSEWKLEI